MDAKSKIFEQVSNNAVVLYMKGTPQFPQCGFSALAVEVLKRSGVQIKKIVAVDVLIDAEARQGVKDFANWPTIPQLFVKGEFVGGADILREMFQNGELAPMLPPEVLRDDATE